MRGKEEDREGVLWSPKILKIDRTPMSDYISSNE